MRILFSIYTILGLHGAFRNATPRISEKGLLRECICVVVSTWCILRRSILVNFYVYFMSHEFKVEYSIYLNVFGSFCQQDTFYIDMYKEFLTFISLLVPITVVF